LDSWHSFSFLYRWCYYVGKDLDFPFNLHEMTGVELLTGSIEASVALTFDSCNLEYGESLVDGT
jgi:hypothetical protein